MVADEAELVEAAFAVEEEAVKVAIDATVAIWRGHQLAIFDFVDGSAGVRKNDGWVGDDDDLGSFLDHIFDP